MDERHLAVRAGRAAPGRSARPRLGARLERRGEVVGHEADVVDAPRRATRESAPPRSRRRWAPPARSARRWIRPVQEAEAHALGGERHRRVDSGPSPRAPIAAAAPPRSSGRRSRRGRSGHDRSWPVLTPNAAQRRWRSRPGDIRLDAARCAARRSPSPRPRLRAPGGPARLDRAARARPVRSTCSASARDR